MQGALVFKTANQSIPNAAWTMAVWDDESINGYDIGGFFNPSQPSRLTVPAGVSRVRIQAQSIWQKGNGTGLRQLVVKKNGSFFPGDPIQNGVANNVTTADIGAVSPILNVTPGDYFEVELYHTDGGAIDLLASTGTFFSIESIECCVDEGDGEPETSDIAVGGTITTAGDYKIHVFNASDDLEIIGQPVDDDFEYLLVGGGGPGGYAGGGAGAGGGGAGQ